VLFTDIVASTQHAAATGDGSGGAVLHRFGEITTELAQRSGGTVVKSTGDGHHHHVRRPHAGHLLRRSLAR
jgi:class 3 adenylate cyclase